MSLSALIARMIAAEGPMPVARFMALANGHPQFGYYAGADPLGGFTTAPEISQMFGELVGLALAAHWLAMGKPPAVCLAEAGPGRGTLIADALRASARLPGFHGALSLHLVETSGPLRARQAQAAAAAAPTLAPPLFHDDLDGLPDDRPLLFVANEFLDALPVRQLVAVQGVWVERLVTLTADGGFAFALDRAPSPHAALLAEATRGLAAEDGRIAEIRPAALAACAAIGRRLASRGGLALIFDYGYGAATCGEPPPPLGSLQALYDGRRADPLQRAGEADLTALVDFDATATALREAGAVVQAIVAQGGALGALGIATRAAQLAAARPDQAEAIAAARDRLTAPAAMGLLFKLLVATGPADPRPDWLAGIGENDK